MTTALSKFKELIINYCYKAYEHSGVNYFWSVKNSLEVLDKLHAFDKPFETVDGYDFSTLYTTLPHYFIKQKFSYLIEWCFKKADCKYKIICCNREDGERSFFSNEKDKYKNFTYWTCEHMTDSVNFLLDKFLSVSAIKFTDRSWEFLWAQIVLL